VKVVVHVMPKSTVLDPQGKAVHHALGALDYGEVADVRIGKRIELEVEGTDPETIRERAESAARDLLSNPVIEDFRVEIVG
jgi:phosphoribosylformylglycinamidine synthase